jgi:hypothetical protein
MNHFVAHARSANRMALQLRRKAVACEGGEAPQVVARFQELSHEAMVLRDQAMKQARIASQAEASFRRVYVWVVGAAAALGVGLVTAAVVSRLIG